MTLNSPEEVENYMQHIDGKPFVEFKLSNGISQGLNVSDRIFIFINLFIHSVYVILIVCPRNS